MCKFLKKLTEKASTDESWVVTLKDTTWVTQLIDHIPTSKTRITILLTKHILIIFRNLDFMKSTVLVIMILGYEKIYFLSNA